MLGLLEGCARLWKSFLLCAPAHWRGATNLWGWIYSFLQNAWTDGAVDSRNVATLEFVVAVTNIADTPPVFISAPPITRMPQTSLPGDFVLSVVAKDGDAGPGRPIRWKTLTSDVYKLQQVQAGHSVQRRWGVLPSGPSVRPVDRPARLEGARLQPGGCADSPQDCCARGEKIFEWPEKDMGESSNSPPFIVSSLKTLCLPSYKQFLLLLNSNDFRSTHRLRRQTLWRAEPTSLTIRARPSRLPSLSTTLSTGPRDSFKLRELFLMGGLIYRCTMNGWAHIRVLRANQCQGGNFVAAQVFEEPLLHRSI